MKYSVVVVDDHKLLSQAIGEMVNAFESFKVLYTCKNGKEVTEKFSKSPKNIPDIVLVDVNTPIMNGVETTEWIVKHHPNIKIMALSDENANDTILKMLKAGAVGCLLKNAEKRVLEKALLEMMDSGFYHTKNVANLLLASVSGRNRRNRVSFKDNEMKFMKLACSELTYKEIAGKMFLSPKTIDGYRDSLFTKLNIRNRVGLVMYAIKNKIYTP